MRLMIIHDDFSNIIGIIASSPDAPLAYPQIKPGERVAQVDAPDIGIDLTPQQLHDQLSDLVKNYRVEMRGAKAELLKK